MWTFSSVIVAAKRDLVFESNVLAVEGVQFARKYGLGYVETSAKYLQNVFEPFLEVVRIHRLNETIAMSKEVCFADKMQQY